MKKSIKPPALSTSFSETGRNAKKRFDNILNSKSKKTSIIALIFVLLVVGVAGTLIACNRSALTSDIPNLYFTLPVYSHLPDKALLSTNSWRKGDTDVISDYQSPFEREYDSYLSIPENCTIPVTLDIGYDDAKAVPNAIDLQLSLMNPDRSETAISVNKKDERENYYEFMPQSVPGEYIYTAKVKFEQGTVMYNFKIVVNQFGLPDGVFIYTRQASYSPNTDEIVAVWRNNTSKNLIFGDSFELEKRSGDTWMKISKGDDPVFNAIGHLLPLGKEVEHTYPINVFTKRMEMEAGTYRITTSFYDDSRSGNPYPITAEFEVK